MKWHTRITTIVFCHLMLGCRLVLGLVGHLHGSVEMPCGYHQLSCPIEKIRVYWQRKDLVLATVLEGKVDEQHVTEMYKGRAHLTNPDQLQDGNFNLTLINLTLQDDGEYTCIVFCKSSSVLEIYKINVELKVTADFSPPMVKNISSSEKLQYGQEHTLNCSSQGGFEVLEAMWINTSDGREVQGGQFHTRREGDIIHVTSTITLNITSNSNISCLIVTENGNWTSQPFIIEVPKKEEKEEEKEVSRALAIILSVIIGGIVAAITIVILVKWRHRQRPPPSYIAPNDQMSEL